MRLLTLETSRKARDHAGAYQGIDGVELVGAVDTIPDGLPAFADEFGIAWRFETRDAAPDRGAFDAVNDYTPDGDHFPTVRAVIAVGKHVLCEKPPAAPRWLALEAAADVATGRGAPGRAGSTQRPVVRGGGGRGRDGGGRRLAMVPPRRQAATLLDPAQIAGRDRNEHQV